MRRTFPAGYLVAVMAALAACVALAQDTSQKSRSTAEGIRIFKNSCSVCHSMKPGVIKTGPSLSGILRSPTPKAERRVRSIITNGKDTMPPFRDKLTQRQISELLEFLRKP